MKPLKTLAVFLFIIAAISNLSAQSGDKIRIILQQPPPNRLGVVDLWSLSITNTTNEDLTIHVGGVASEEKDGLIIEAKSKPFTIKPGTTKYKHTDFSSAEIKYNNGKYKEILMRTGNAPEGNYTICVTAYNESGEVIGQENCITQQVQQLGSITLISPSDGEELDPDTLPGLTFSWTPLPKADIYKLRIVELKGDQSPEVALRTNQPIFEKELKTTSTHVAPSQVKVIVMGMKYAWQITSGDVQSEIYSFRYGEKKVTLISPANGEEISTEKPINFSWSPIPGNSGYTLRIVELKGDQSPEEAFKNNSDVFTVNCNTAGYTFRGGEHLPWPLPRKKKYAWQVTGGNFQSETFTFITSLGTDTTTYIVHKFDLPVDLIVYDEDGNVKTLILKTKTGGYNIFEVKSYQPGIPVYGDYDGCRTVYCNNPNHPPGCGWKECNK